MPTANGNARKTLLVCVLVLAVVLAMAALAKVADLARPVLVPTAVAVLLAGLLMPLQVLFNHRLKLPRSAVAALTIAVSAGAVTLLMWLSGAQLANGIDEVKSATVFELSTWEKHLADSPIPLGRGDIEEALQTATEWVSNNSGSIAAGAVGAGFSAASFVVSALVCLFATFFFLAQGDRIASWLILLLPVEWRERPFEAARRGWVTLGNYTKMQVVLSGADAAGIGLGAAVLGVPFVFPLTAITFVLCFVPFVGAIVSGALVVIVALAFKGPLVAVLMLIVVVVVQQAESNLLGPLLLGKAVNLHPLAVLLSVTAGVYLVGFVGGLFAVPLVATANTMVKYLRGRDPFPQLARGGSALTDSPRKLVGEVTPIRMPKLLGSATPGWLLGERRRQVRQALTAPTDTDQGEDSSDSPDSTGLTDSAGSTAKGRV